jgi:hypothetical protein
MRGFTCVITGEKQGQNHRNKEGHIMNRANKFLSRYFQSVAFNL